jgi:DNA polymerase
MHVDRRWREKVEALERAGLEYVSRDRLAEAVGRLQACGDEQRPATGDRWQELAILRNEVAACTRCAALACSRTQTVFSDGTPAAELCFVGEAPGYEEDRQGLPFVGKAGQLLTQIIEACRLKRQDVYICNLLKCRPPENRNPMPDEIANCLPFLERQLSLIQPKVLVALGKYPTAVLLGLSPEKIAITRMRGQVHEYRGIPLMITLHPAYLLRNPEAKKDVWRDMIQVMRMIGRPID